METLRRAQQAMDHWFFHLVCWDLRFIRGQRRVVWWVGMGAIGAAVAVGVWHAAVQSNKIAGGADAGRTLALALLLATPPRDKVADLAQMTLGYDLMRFAAYTTIAFGKALMPALAAGTVAGDREAGRLQDIRMLPIHASIVYFAKVIAAALPFLVLSAALLLIFSGAAIMEYMPIAEAARLAQESTGQILMTSCVVVACSAFCRTTAGSRAVAHLLLWGFIPAAWLTVLLRLSAVPPMWFGTLHLPNWQEQTGVEPVEFSTVCMAQACATAGTIVLSTLLTVRRLNREDRAARPQPNPSHHNSA